MTEECEHEFQPDLLLTTFRCEKCGFIKTYKDDTSKGEKDDSR
jgi:RNase P subunit RPR2